MPSPRSLLRVRVPRKKVITNINRTDSRARSIVTVRGRVAHIKRPCERRYEPGMNGVVVEMRRGSAEAAEAAVAAEKERFRQRFAGVIVRPVITLVFSPEFRSQVYETVVRAPRCGGGGRTR